MKIIKMATWYEEVVDVMAYEYNFKRVAIIYGMGFDKVKFFESYNSDTPEQYYFSSNYLGDMSDKFQRKAMKKFNREGIDILDHETDTDYFSVPILRNKDVKFDIEIL